MFSKHHILFHRANQWHRAVTGSTQHIARYCLSRGDNVTYCEGLPHWWRWWRAYRPYQTPESDSKRLRVISPFTLLPLTRAITFRGIGARLARTASIPLLRRVITKERGVPDVIWSSEPGGSALKNLFPQSRFVFQVVDWYPGFHGNAIREVEARDYARADHIVTVGYSLRDYLMCEYGIPSARITACPPGVNRGQYGHDHLEPSAIADAPYPRAVWIGDGAKIDPELLRALARELHRRGGSVVIAGPPPAWLDRGDPSMGNVYSIGSVDPEHVPALLAHADIGCMLYRRDHAGYRIGQSPIKLYEYAAAGLPILTTPHEEFKWLQPPVRTVDNITDIAPALDAIFAQYQTWSKQAQSFAADNDWSSRFRLLEEQGLL